MKKWVKSFGTIMLAGSLLIGGTALSAVFQEPGRAYADEVQKNIVSVVGKGELSIKPDIVYLSTGVDTSAATAEEAQKTNGAKISKITSLLKNTWKVADKDIQSSQFSVQPNYTYNDKDGQQVKSYNANHTLVVAYRDLTKVGELLDAVSAAGSNNIGNARFAVEDTAAFEAQVIEKAMANADAKAGAIAKAATLSLGQVIIVSQNDGGNYPVYFEQNLKAVPSAADDAGGTTVQPGEVKVTTQLSVTYELK